MVSISPRYMRAFTYSYRVSGQKSRKAGPRGRLCWLALLFAYCEFLVVTRVCFGRARDKRVIARLSCLHEISIGKEKHPPAALSDRFK